MKIIAAELTIKIPIVTTTEEALKRTVEYYVQNAKGSHDVDGIRHAVDWKEVEVKL